VELRGKQKDGNKEAMVSDALFEGAADSYGVETGLLMMCDRIIVYGTAEDNVKNSLERCAIESTYENITKVKALSRVDKARDNEKLTATPRREPVLAIIKQHLGLNGQLLKLL